MTEAKRLIDQASPLPWRWETYADEGEAHYLLLPADPKGETDRDHPAVFSVTGHEWEMDWRNEEADAALIVHAVNHLPDYEAAVDALTELKEAAMDMFSGNPAKWARLNPALELATAVLHRLRGAP